MPSENYQKHKKSIYKYQETHPVKVEDNRKYCKVWRERNPEVYREQTKLRVRRFYQWKSVSKVYLNILLF